MKFDPGTIYPLSALRATVLHVQRLTTPNTTSAAVNPGAITDLVKILGYIQVDTLHVVNRAHYVTLWSRLGSYEKDQLDEIIYHPGKRLLYEGWGHAASIIPLEYYRYQRWRMDRKVSFNPTFHDWLKKSDNQELVKQTLERIRSEGELTVGAFEHKSSRKGEWFEWKPPKIALEALFAKGDLMVADRVNFRRVYDLKERVLPAWVDNTPVDPDDARRFCLEQAAKSLGIFETRHLTFYAYMRATPARTLIKALIKEGIIVEIQGESLNGVKTWMVHRDNLQLLAQAADGEIQAERTTLLNPFDPVFWAPDRDQLLWGFNQVLEAYKPAADRIYGYFCFPVLDKDRLIGRFDPKLDRKKGILHLKAIYLEPGITPEDDMVSRVAAAMQDFLSWHAAKSIEIDKSDPPGFAEKLLNAM